jgi:hypothetical protein
MGVGVRRLHLRLLTVSRFAGLLPSLDLAYPLRKEVRRKSSNAADPNFYVAHPYSKTRRTALKLFGYTAWMIEGAWFRKGRGELGDPEVDERLV